MKKILLLTFTLKVYLFSEFIRYEKVVIDDKTNLMWQDQYHDNEPKTKENSDEYVPNITLTTWNKAISYCRELTLNGYSDWRLPNLTELSSLIIYKKKYPQIDIDSAFRSVASSKFSGYWTSTSRKHFPGLAMRINFYNGDESVGVKTTSFYVRCVRQTSTNSTPSSNK